MVRTLTLSIERFDSSKRATSSVREECDRPVVCQLMLTTKNRLKANIKYLMVFGAKPSIVAVVLDAVVFDYAHCGSHSSRASVTICQRRVASDTARSRTRKMRRKRLLEQEYAFRRVAPMYMCVPSVIHERAYTWLACICVYIMYMCIRRAR